MPRRRQRVATLMIDPSRVFCYWTVEDAAVKAARRRVADRRAPITLRVHDVTWIRFDGTNSNEVQEHVVRELEGSWYIDLARAGRTVLAEIGVRARDGRFAAIARSNVVELPRDSAAAEAPVVWRRVPDGSAVRSRDGDDAEADDVWAVGADSVPAAPSAAMGGGSAEDDAGGADDDTREEDWAVGSDVVPVGAEAVAQVPPGAVEPRRRPVPTPVEGDWAVGADVVAWSSPVDVELEASRGGEDAWAVGGGDLVDAMRELEPGPEEPAAPPLAAFDWQPEVIDWEPIQSASDLERSREEWRRVEMEARESEAAAVDERGAASVSAEWPPVGEERASDDIAGLAVEGRVGSPSSGALSSGALSSSARPRSTPSLEVLADLVLYGRATPGTEVVIDGVPVRVGDDGTFELRFALPAARPSVQRPESASFADEEET